MTPINWNPEMYGRFVKAIEAAKAQQTMEFVFDGHTFVVAYAEHLAEYLSDLLANSLGVQ